MFTEDNILILNKKTTSKDELFHIIAKKGIALGCVENDEESIFIGFKEREALGTTGFQDGFGIPHCKIPIIKKPTIIFVKSLIAIEWDSLDKKPLENLFALFIPVDNNDQHLEMLVKISRKLMDENFRNKVKNTNKPKELYEIISEVI